MTDNRTSLLSSIASTIADYRNGEVPPPNSAHVERWINQFDATVQDLILAEVDQVLKKTYITKPLLKTFLSGLVTNSELAGHNPRDFWMSVNFLSIQGGGNSQREMLTLFNEILQVQLGISIAQCGSVGGPYIYLDDIVFTGNRIKNDLIAWLTANAPPTAMVHIIVVAFHRGGRYYAQTNISKAGVAAKKAITTRWWRCLEIEDRKSFINRSDVLRPSSLPGDVLTQAYVQSLKYSPVLRQGSSVGETKIFTSDAGRCLLEQEMLKAGVRIRSICPNLNLYQRPLGNMILETLGFGALIITYRNCPNNAPLAFWVGSPWYPLFPRKTN